MTTLKKEQLNLNTMILLVITGLGTIAWQQNRAENADIKQGLIDLKREMVPRQEIQVELQAWRDRAAAYETRQSAIESRQTSTDARQAAIELELDRLRGGRTKP